MRRHVLCLDGTWNNAEREVDQVRPQQIENYALYKPTNVLKTFRAIKPVAADGVAQISYYSEGVGSFIGEPIRFSRLQRLSDRFVGGAFAGGFEARIKAAYRFLVANYRSEDQIFIFGFSRGAAQAQSLVRFIDWVGGVLEKQDEYYIPELFATYRRTLGAAGEGAKVFDAIRERTKKPDQIRDPRPVEVEMLGVYEMVFALGSRLGADREEDEVPGAAQRNAFHIGPAPPSLVRVVRQALAIDETRFDYRPQVWKRRGGPAQSLVQLWFPGVHTNVGGGRKNDHLENGALHWMIGEAKARGLDLDGTYLGFYKAGLDGRGDGPSLGFRLLETVRGKRNQGVRSLDHGPNAGIDLHPSARELMEQDSGYRPRRLLQYLERHPEAGRA